MTAMIIKNLTNLKTKTKKAKKLNNNSFHNNIGLHTYFNMILYIQSFVFWYCYVCFITKLVIYTYTIYKNKNGSIYKFDARYFIFHLHNNNIIINQYRAN